MRKAQWKVERIYSLVACLEMTSGERGPRRVGSRREVEAREEARASVIFEEGERGEGRGEERRGFFLKGEERAVGGSAGALVLRESLKEGRGC